MTNHPDKFPDVRDLCLPIPIDSEDLNQVGTLTGVVTILFDTAAVVVTSLKTIALLRYQKGVGVRHRQSLISLLLWQGVHVSCFVAEVFLNSNKVSPDTGMTPHLLPFMHLIPLQICPYGDSY